MNTDNIKQILSIQLDVTTEAPDTLWSLLDVFDAAARELQTAVEAVEARLMSIDYDPAPVY